MNEKIQNIRYRRDAIVFRTLNSGAVEYFIVNGIHPATGNILCTDLQTGVNLRMDKQDLTPFWLQAGDYIRDNDLRFKIKNFERSEVKATGEIGVMMRLIIQDFNRDGEERITPIAYVDHFALCDEKGRLL